MPHTRPLSKTSASRWARANRVSTLGLRPGRRALAYLIPVSFVLVVAQSWFQSGTVIASGDLVPPFVSGSEYRSLWNHEGGGEGGLTYAISELPYRESLRAAVWAGISESAFQRIWFSLLYTGVAAAVVFFTFGITSSPLAAGTSGILAALNPFWFHSNLNHLMLVAAILSCAMGGLLLRASLGGNTHGVVAFSLASTGLGLVAGNPPLVVLVGVWILVSVLVAIAAGGWQAARAAGLFILRAAPLVVLLSLWWSVPALLTVTDAGYADRLGFAAPSAWAWTHSRGSLLNGITLNTSWAWAFPEYVPFAARLDSGAFVGLKFAFPTLAFLGTLIPGTPRRRTASALTLAALTAIWLAKGFHPPLGSVNRWLYEHLPGFWLFREPYKILLLAAIAFAVLGGLAVASLSSIRGRKGTAGRVLAGGLVLAGSAYVHPLLNGEVVPDKRDGLPPSHVRVPHGWRQAADFLNALPTEGKLLVLPQPDFYQLPTTWGYYGASFTRMLIRRPVLEAQPGAYLRSERSVSALLTVIERGVIEGDENLGRWLRALGVRYVLLRRDLPTSSQRSYADWSQLKRGLLVSQTLSHLASFDIVDVFMVGSKSGEVYAARPAFKPIAPDEVPTVLSTLNETSAIVHDSRTESAGHSESLPDIRFERTHPYRFRVHVHRATAPFLLVLTESHSPGWRLQVPWEGQGERHVRVNGYANGWIVDKPGDYTLAISYAPQSLASAAGLASLFGLMTVLLARGVRSKRMRDFRARKASQPDPISSPARDLSSSAYS